MVVKCLGIQQVCVELKRLNNYRGPLFPCTTDREFFIVSNLALETAVLPEGYLYDSERSIITNGIERFPVLSFEDLQHKSLKWKGPLFTRGLFHLYLINIFIILILQCLTIKYDIFSLYFPTIFIFCKEVNNLWFKVNYSCSFI